MLCSDKVDNQRHLACVSKFAIVSTNLAAWRKRAGGASQSQQCKYRDPTVTTWEKPCPNPSLPLLQVCASHLVQLNPAPPFLRLSAEQTPEALSSYNAEKTVDLKSSVTQLPVLPEDIALCDDIHNHSNIKIESTSSICLFCSHDIFICLLKFLF
ncbi:unnamed protein product [Protopolystoma xenopodis]|uniref:Uncharacterized protein n=1 Tax=Protopolystoma xenopodis TaxID=117903 RepID=A0A448XHH9_9PLAT|nr:unnamed protein product [Protopolystoma xenopodis]